DPRLPPAPRREETRQRPERRGAGPAEDRGRAARGPERRVRGAIPGPAVRRLRGRAGEERHHDGYEEEDRPGGYPAGGEGGYTSKLPRNTIFFHVRLRSVLFLFFSYLPFPSS